MHSKEIIEVTIAAGRRRGPLRNIACLMQEKIETYSASLLDIEHFWANHSPVLTLKVRAGEGAAAVKVEALKDLLYAAAERALDQALFAQPWETIPLIVDSRGDRSGNGLVVYAQIRAGISQYAQELSQVVLHCLAQEIDLKQLAFGLGVDVFKRCPAAGISLRARMLAAFSEHEFEQLTRRQPQELASAPIALVGLFHEFAQAAESSEQFVLDVYSRLGFSPRECVYIAYVCQQIAAQKLPSSAAVLQQEAA